MKELSRTELAIVKRTAQNTKSLRTKRDKLKSKIEQYTEELNVINETIDKFEAPIKELTEGLTSEEVLDYINNPKSEETTEENKEVIDDTEVAETVEVNTEESETTNEETTESNEELPFFN